MGGYKTWADGAGGKPTATDFNNYISKQSIIQFATVAERDAQMSTHAGAMCFCADTGETYIRKSSSWVSAKPRFCITTSQFEVIDSLILEAVPNTAFTIEQNGKYIVKFGIHFITLNTVANDMEMGFVYPAGVSGEWYVDRIFTTGTSLFYDPIGKNTHNWDQTTTLGSASSSQAAMVQGYGWLNAPTSGDWLTTIQLKVAENTAVTGSTGVRVIAGTWFKIWKV